MYGVYVFMYACMYVRMYVCIYIYIYKVAVTLLNPVTNKIFPEAEFPGGRGVLIA